jgi:hypothetical protein
VTSSGFRVIIITAAPTPRWSAREARVERSDDRGDDPGEHGEPSRIHEHPILIRSDV